MEVKRLITLNGQKVLILITKIDGLGATSATRYGDNRTNYRFDVGQAVYAPGTLIYVFEIIDGWCRIYWNNHNEWIWHERLIVKEVF